MRDQSIPPSGTSVPPLSFGSHSAQSAAPLLSAAWFRQERERIALGRPRVAAFLGVPLGRIAALETQNHGVPAEWLPKLAELGFRIQGTPVEDLPGRQESGEIHSSSAAIPIPRDPSSAHLSIPPELPELPRGRWLRDRRYALSLSVAAVSRQLVLPDYALSLLESQDLVIPADFLPVLGRLRFFALPEGEGATPLRLSGLPLGSLLQRQRRRKGYSARSVAERLGVRAAVVEIVEARRWPLPPEWMPTLQQLGFSAVDEPSSALMQVPVLVPPPVLSAPVFAASSASSSEPTVPFDPQSAPVLTGAWLKTHRQRLRLFIRFICDRLQTTPRQLVFLETHDAPVPADWLPTLTELGFPVPTELLARARAAGSAQSGAARTAVPAPPSAGHGGPPEPAPGAPASPAYTLAATVDQAPEGTSDELPEVTADLTPGLGEPDEGGEGDEGDEGDEAASRSPVLPSALSSAPGRVNGTWMQLERQRLGKSRNQLRQLLGVDWQTYARIEDRALPVPHAWRTALRDAGFLFPSQRASALSPQSPPAAVPQSELRGHWLRDARTRQHMSAEAVWKALRVHRLTLASIEQYDGVLPRDWLPVLQRLGLSIDVAPATAPAAAPAAAATPAAVSALSSASRPSQPELPVMPDAVAVQSDESVPPVHPDAPVSAESVRAEESPRELLEMVVRYRLILGRRAGQTAAEAMAWIAHDLRQLGLEQSVTYEDLSALTDSILRRRLSR